MLFQYLPFEIHQQIFQLLPRDTAYRCIFVCKSLYQPAIEAYYNKILISQNQIPFVRRKLLLNNEDQDQQFSYGELTKELTIYDRGDGLFDGIYRHRRKRAALLENEEFFALLSYLPNLKKLYIHCDTQYYKDMLNNNPRTAEYLKNLEEISGQDLELSYNFCQTLTRLELPYHIIYRIKGQNGNTLFFLPHFTQLAHLSITNTHDRNLSFLEILDTCPNLVSLKFESSYSAPEHHASTVLNNMVKNINWKASSDNVTYTKSSKMVAVSTHLQELDLTLPTLTESDIKFIVHHTSPCLNTLRVFMDKNNLDGWIEYHGEDTVMSLFKHLSRVRNLSFICSGIHPPQGETNTPRFLRFLWALKGDRHVNSTLEYDLLVDNNISQQSIMKNGKSMSFVYPIDCRNNEHHLLSENKNIIAADICAPISEGPGIINLWKHYISPNSGQSLEQVLNYALTYCHQLTRIEIQYHERDTLHFFARPSDKIDSDYSMTKAATTTQSSLTKIKMDSSMLTQDLLDLFSAKLPNIESIKCLILLDWHNYYQECEVRHLKDRSYIYNLTRFQKLDTFYMDVYLRTNDGDFDYIFIQFKYAGGDEMQFYKIELVDNELGVGEEQIATCTATTADFINKFKTGNSSIITFECKKIQMFAVCYDNYIIGEFQHGIMQIPLFPIICPPNPLIEK